MRDGVTMRDPSTVYLDWDVHPRARRHPRAERHPARRDVGRGGERHRRRQPAHRQRRSGASARVWAAIVESSTVEDEATVGPFSHLRPGSVVGRGAEVGNFAELKNTRLGRGLQAAPHELPRRRRGRRAASTSAPARSPPTTTASTQAPHDDRRRRVHRRRHDDRRARATSATGARTGAGAVVTRDVPAGQARGRRPGADPRAARATEPDAASLDAGVGTRRG